MTRQFVPLTAEQLASSENGTLKLEYRDCGKVMQLVWFKEPFKQSDDPVITIDENGHTHRHLICGGDTGRPDTGRPDTGCPVRFDLFVCEEQPAKYGGQLTGVPVEIVEYMLDQQEAQGNKRDVSVFERNFADGALTGGFDWGYAGRFDDMYEANDRNYEPMLEYLRKLKDDEGHK